MAKNTGVRWKGRPLEKDFAAAAGFLSLIYPTARGHRLLAALRRATMVRHPAKDLLRASRLPLLPSDEWHVETDLRRIRKGKALSPVLLIRGTSRAVSRWWWPTAIIASAPFATTTRLPRSPVSSSGTECEQAAIRRLGGGPHMAPSLAA